MSQKTLHVTGGCLCGAVRFEAQGEPIYAGYCCCADCRRASGSGFVPFMSYPADRLSISGETRPSRTPAFRGGQAVRNHCAQCGSLIFGGVVGQDNEHTLYAGTLDEPSLFKPTMAIFTRDRPAWVVLPESIPSFETLPG